MVACGKVVNAMELKIIITTLLQGCKVHCFIHDYKISTGKDPVKFGNKPDLEPKMCHDLLYRYMSPVIKERKISQKVFIK